MSSSPLAASQPFYAVRDGGAQQNTGQCRHQLVHAGSLSPLARAKVGPRSSLASAHPSALQRVWSIPRRTRLMRSQGCQRRGGLLFLLGEGWGWGEGGCVWVA